MLSIRKSSLVVIAIAALAICAIAQKADSQALNQQIAVLFQAGKFDDAIPLAERVVKMERAKSRDSDAYALAATNLGMLYKERMRARQKSDQSAPLGQRLKHANEIQKDAERAEKNFRDVVAIYARNSKADSVDAALVRNELAWVLNNYLAAKTAEESRGRIDEAEKLFLEAIAIQEKAVGLDADAVLKSLLGLGDFYMRWNNFEKALPYYERYIATVEQKSGPSARALIPALRAVLETLAITLQENEANELAKRIGSITGRDEPIPTTMPYLDLRARKIERVNPPGSGERKPVLSSVQATSSSVYPTVLSSRVQSVIVRIVVDETGRVIEAKVEDPKVKYAAAVEEAARGSEFRPFVYKGIPRKMRGTMSYSYMSK